MIWPSGIETPEDMFHRKQLDEKRKAMGLETSTEQAMRWLEERREQAAFETSPKKRTVKSK